MKNTKELRTFIQNKDKEKNEEQRKFIHSIYV